MAKEIININININIDEWISIILGAISHMSITRMGSMTRTMAVSDFHLYIDLPDFKLLLSRYDDASLLYVSS